MMGMSLDLATVNDVFSVSVTNGTANLDLDDISVKVACRDTNGCFAQPRLPTEVVTVEYAQNFDGLDIMAAEIGDGWNFFNGVFGNNGATFLFGYGGDAPNGTGQISGLVDNQGGPPQGTQQLSVFSDYNCCGGTQGHFDPNGLVETNVFQEPRTPGIGTTISAADVGTVWTFSFDGKADSVAGVSGSTTAFAFFKILDQPGFNLVGSETLETTVLPADWDRFSVEITIIEDWEGAVLQYGFQTNASNFENANNFYDNVELTITSYSRD